MTRHSCGTELSLIYLFFLTESVKLLIFGDHIQPFFAGTEPMFVLSTRLTTCVQKYNKATITARITLFFSFPLTESWQKIKSIKKTILWPED